MTSQRKLILLSGYLLAFAPLAPLGGCSSDDSAFASDGGADSPVEPVPDAGGHNPTPDSGGGGPTPDAGGDDAASDTGATQTGDASEDSGVPPPADPIAVWHFDEGSGTTAYDSSGHLHTATLVNGATFGPGKHGTGLSPNASGWAFIPAPAAVDSGTGGDDAGADASDAAADGGVDGGAFDAAVPDTGTSDAGASDGESDASADASDAIDASNASDAADAATTGVDSGEADDSGGEDSGPSIDAGFVPLAFDTTKSFSIGCWVKVYSQGPGQWESIFSRSGENLAVFTLKLRGDPTPPPGGEDFDFDFPGQDNTATGIYTVAQSTTSPTVSPANGTTSYWYHLVGVLDVQPAASGGTTVAIYVNGAVQTSVAPGTASILEAVGDTFIGASLFGTVGAAFNGVIDEVYLYDRALSPAEVMALYKATN